MTEIQRAIYKGIKKAGSFDGRKEDPANFIYLFEIDGSLQELKISAQTSGRENNPGYPIQNSLKVGYPFRLTVKNDTVIAVQELPAYEIYEFSPAVHGTPGERSLRNFLSTALMPVGTVLYVYGGGWNWQDTGSAVQTRTLGVSRDWIHFFKSQTAEYAYKEAEPSGGSAVTYYPYNGYNEYYYAGLDCSGYLGWVLYNTFETEDGRAGYVGPSTTFAKRLAERGLGSFTPGSDMDLAHPRGGTVDPFSIKPGDIVSIRGHVWISLGTCRDGSIVILHSSPSLSRENRPGGGVQVSAVGRDKKCEAYRIADRYMSRNCPEWYSRYPVYLCDPEVYLAAGQAQAGIFSFSFGGDSRAPLYPLF